MRMEEKCSWVLDPLLVGETPSVQIVTTVYQVQMQEALRWKLHVSILSPAMHTAMRMLVIRRMQWTNKLNFELLSFFVIIMGSYQLMNLVSVSYIAVLSNELFCIGI